MDNLKSIWKQVDCDPKELKIMNKKIELTFEKLNKEDNLKKKYKPIMFIGVVLFAFFFGYIVFLENGSLVSSQIIGVGLVTLSGIAICFLSQVIKIPFKEFEHDKSSIDFLKVVKGKLGQSKKMYTLGLGLQFILLTSGLYLLIFYSSTNMNSGYVGLFFGAMFSLAGIAIGKSTIFFRTHYRATYQVIDNYIQE